MVAVPQGTEYQLGVVTLLLVHIAAAREGFLIVHHLLHQIIDGQGVDVDVLFPRGVSLVLGSDCVVGSIEKSGDVIALHVAQ